MDNVWVVKNGYPHVDNKHREGGVFLTLLLFPRYNDRDCLTGIVRQNQAEGRYRVRAPIFPT